MVMLAKYQEEVKVRAVVQAQQRVDVAELERLAAEQTRQKEILLGQGEVERKRLVLAADGALAQKLEALEKINSAWANAYSSRLVPQLVMGGGGADAADVATTDFSQMMQLLVAGQLGLDLSVPRGVETTTAGSR